MRRIIGTEVFPGLYFSGLFCVCVPLAVMTFRYNPHQHYPSSTGKSRLLYRMNYRSNGSNVYCTVNSVRSFF